MADPADNPAKPNKNPERGISIQLPGLSLAFRDTPGIVGLILIIVLICAITVYIQTKFPDTVKSFISSINPKAESKSDNNETEQLVFWVPKTEEYNRSVAQFEQWLSDNNDWWGKVATNLRVIDGKNLILDGYQYTLQQPKTDSELAGGNPQQAIQNQALKLFNIKDLRMMWIEIDRRPYK